MSQDEGHTEKKATLLSAQAAIISALIGGLALVVSSIPIFLGVIAWKGEQERQRDETAEYDRRLASLVAAWTELEVIAPPEPDDIDGLPATETTVVIANRSTDPVMYFGIAIGAMSEMADRRIVVIEITSEIPPCTRVEIAEEVLREGPAERMTPEGNQLVEQISDIDILEISFIDQLGNQWTREGLGRYEIDDSLTNLLGQYDSGDASGPYSVSLVLGSEGTVMDSLENCQDGRVS